MIVPVLHRILIRQDKFDERDKNFKAARAAGIVLLDEEFSREQAAVDTGEVLAIGETAFRDFNTESPIKVGEKIAFARHAGKVVTDPDTDEKLLVLNDEDVVSILKKGQ